jgi:hypothetical protein
VGVLVGVGVNVWVGVSVLVGVEVRVAVGVSVNVIVKVTAVAVRLGVCVGLGVFGVLVGRGVSVVGTPGGSNVAVDEEVGVEVADAVSEGMEVGVDGGGKGAEIGNNSSGLKLLGFRSSDLTQQGVPSFFQRTMYHEASWFFPSTLTCSLDSISASIWFDQSKHCAFTLVTASSPVSGGGVIVGVGAGVDVLGTAGKWTIPEENRSNSAKAPSTNTRNKIITVLRFIRTFPHLSCMGERPIQLPPNGHLVFLKRRQVLLYQNELFDQNQEKRSLILVFNRSSNRARSEQFDMSSALSNTLISSPSFRITNGSSG